MSEWVWAALGISWATSIALLWAFISTAREVERLSKERDELWDRAFDVPTSFAPVVARPAPQTEGERDHETD